MGSSDCSNPREHYFFNPRTRDWQQAPCETLRCFACRREAIRKRAGAIALAMPEKFLVITDVPGEYIEFAAKRKTLERALQRKGYDLGEWCVTLEVNQNPALHHANVLRRGEAIPHGLLSELSERSGFGRVVSDDPVIDRVALGKYVLKDAIENETAAEFLASNGGRLTHSSRGFFLDEEGGRINAELADDLAVMIGWK